MTSDPNHTQMLVIKITISTAVTVLIAIQLWTGFELQSETIALVVVALLPWLSTIIESVELPGGGKLKFREIRKVKRQLNSLERLTEQEYALRLQEMRSDIEEIRLQLPGVAKNESLPTTTESAENEFFAAVSAYRRHRDISEWKARVAVDKRLATGAGRLPTIQFKDLLSDAPEDQEIAMAVASSLGTAYPGEPDHEAAALLVQMLASPFERVRYRAVRSIIRRAERIDSSRRAREVMADGVRDALRRESVPAVHDPLLTAASALGLR